LLIFERQDGIKFDEQKIFEQQHKVDMLHRNKIEDTEYSLYLAKSMSG